MLSNGPGDPQENTFCIGELKKMIGGNQPVRDLAAGRTYITSQNHGYAVVAESLKGVGVESFRNANDGSCEGMEYPEKHCFTVQFHPEAASGPRDTAILFDRFVQRMEEMKHS